MALPFPDDLYADESQMVDALTAKLSWRPDRRRRVRAQAKALVAAMRNQKSRGSTVEDLLRHYRLDTAEGLAVISLAEALMRVPDAATANALIRDKLSGVDWRSGQVAEAGWLVRAAQFGFSIGKVTLESLLARAGEPVIRRAIREGVRMMGRQFVIGQTIEDALSNARAEMGKGYALSFDMLGEGARESDAADRYFAAYHHAIDHVGRAKIADPRTGISVKLSALHPRYQMLQADRCKPVLVDRLITLCEQAARYGLTLTIDAEEVDRLELSLQILQDVLEQPNLKGWDGLGLAVQAYQKRAFHLVDHLAEMGARTGHRLRVRLVKGAYWDGEMKRAQVLGLRDYPLYTRKANTDLSYLACAQKMLGHARYLYPMFATHNAHTVAAVLDMAVEARSDFELQCLQGMGGALHDAVLRDRLAPVTLYAPVGTYEDLLAYLVRRLMENGANTSFLNKLNSGAEDKDLLADPVIAAAAHATRRHGMLPLPKNMYGAARRNARGYDLTNDAERAALTPDRPPIFLPLPEADETFVQDAVARSKSAFTVWNVRPVHERAAFLERIADLMERDTPRLMALCATEGKKTISDALAEVREAVDFCRYYAMQARHDFAAEGIALPGPTGEKNTLYLSGRGVFVCISPWNFPLAIFTGQVAAALAAGNTVLAKPAEQTPQIAAAAVSLMHEAGILRDALQLIVGDGKIGAMLVAHADIAGVAFTGSVEVARIINRALAAKDGPIVPLIAETGGQNAMIVDSTALPEQVCDDVILSAFGSAGQRCSALRVLYVQNDLADKMMGMIAGAMAHLRLGDPRDPATDIGPVIDRDALRVLEDHERWLQQNGARLIARAPIDEKLKNADTFFAPVAYEINSIKMLRGEVFGPVLHIVRFAASEIDRVIADINAAGYGLTFGVQTRIAERILKFSAAAAAGNVYVNRSMIGAVVGVQPFGGQGLSGTGPKAGGPHYLHRFATEKVVSQNTAATGGNIDLVSQVD